MEPESYQVFSNANVKYKVLFFAGGETRDDKFNIFTGSFINLMQKVLGNDFDFIRGIYYKYPMMNVIWALNHAQRPVANPENKKIFMEAYRQISGICISPDIQPIIISSSSGSVMAAQTACYLAQQNINKVFLNKPFHLVLGASMICPESDLYKQLIHYQEEGKIGTILNDEMQDEGDTSYGVGGTTRMEAYKNALGLMFPFLSRKFKGASFLNTNTETGHIHRRRSKTVQKAIDYVNIIMIEHGLAGVYYKEKAIAVIKEEII
jgi:hypothetical protein